MTKEQKMMAWHYAKVRKEAVDVLAEIVDESVEDTKAGVCNALASVMQHGCAKDKSRAMLAASAWIWGAHEASALEAEVLDTENATKTVAAAK